MQLEERERTEKIAFFDAQGHSEQPSSLALFKSRASRPAAPVPGALSFSPSVLLFFLCPSSSLCAFVSVRALRVIYFFQRDFVIVSFLRRESKCFLIVGALAVASFSLSSLSLSSPQLFPGVVVVVFVFAKGDTTATESFLSAILSLREAL